MVPYAKARARPWGSILPEGRKRRQAGRRKRSGEKKGTSKKGLKSNSCIKITVIFPTTQKGRGSDETVWGRESCKKNVFNHFVDVRQEGGGRRLAHAILWTKKKIFCSGGRTETRDQSQPVSPMTSSFLTFMHTIMKMIFHSWWWMAEGRRASIKCKVEKKEATSFSIPTPLSLFLSIFFFNGTRDADNDADDEWVVVWRTDLFFFFFFFLSSQKGRQFFSLNW